jgi:outer membrane protein assembly factor BamB
MLGPLTERGLTFMRGRALLCVDPARGEEIWKRTDCVAGSHVFGDDETIAVIAPHASEAQLYRAADGEKIRAARVPPADHRWTTHGRRILTWTDAPGKLVLRLYDPLTESDVWAFDFVIGSKGWIVEQEAVAVMQPDGRFVVIDMADGSKPVDTRVEKEDSLQGIYVLADSQRYILVTNTPAQPAQPNVHLSPAPPGYFSPMVNGRVYAFDRRTGESLWLAPVRVEQFGFPLQQSAQLPVLAFLRQIRRTGNSAGISTSLICLDKRTGKTLLKDDKIPGQTQAFDMRGDLAKAEVKLLLPGTSLALKFSPDPPATKPTAEAAGDTPDEPAVDAPDVDPDGAKETETDAESPDEAKDPNGRDTPQPAEAPDDGADDKRLIPLEDAQGRPLR